jgi:hypothetical protein
MARSLSTLAAAAALSLGAFATTASADTYFFANLTNGGETTAVVLTDGTNPRPASFGFAEFWLNDAQTQLTMVATINNIDVNGLQTPSYTQDNLAAAHIHANATVTPGFNAGVVWGFFGAPDNDTTPSDLVVTPFASGVGGTFTSVWNAPEGNSTTLAAQVNNILTGHAYLNFHTVQNGGGEVRGHLLLPEPASLSLLALPALAMLRRRQR